MLFTYSCGTIREGFTNQKKNSSDEFLVEKKSPLVMPPEFNELPIPNQDPNNADRSINKNKIKDLVSTDEDTTGGSIDVNDSFEESLLKKIKKN